MFKNYLWNEIFNSDPPDPPGQPKVLDHGPTFVSLAWEPPANDGGRPITGYLVEKKEKGTQEWVRVTTFPIPTTDFVVPSLSDGQTYDFRVMAVNEGGIGKPSKTTGPVTATRKMCKYFKIHSSNFYLACIFCFR